MMGPQGGAGGGTGGGTSKGAGGGTGSGTEDGDTGGDTGGAIGGGTGGVVTSTGGIGETGVQQLVDPESIGVEYEYEHFMGMRPPQFRGAKEKAEEFLDQMDKLKRGLHIQGYRMVQLTSFCLLGEAGAWFEVLMRRRGDACPGWVEFRRQFLTNYVSSTLRFQRSQQFEVLRQTSGMSVERYGALFTELLQYASTLVPTEQDRISRFVSLLLEPWFRSMHTCYFQTYEEAVDCALVLEAWAGQERAAREALKRA